MASDMPLSNMTEEEQKLLDSCEDTTEYRIIMRGKEISRDDFETYFKVGGFISAASYNVIAALCNVLKESGISEETLSKFSYINDSIDCSNKQSDIMERFWKIKIEYNPYDAYSYYFCFPCKLFWKRRSEIKEWFMNEGDMLIGRFKAWIKQNGIE